MALDSLAARRGRWSVSPDQLKHSAWLAPLWLAAAWPLGLLCAAYSFLVRFTSRERVTHLGAVHQGPAVYVSWHRHMPYLVGFHGRSGRTYMSSPEPYMRCMCAWARLQGAGIIYGTVANRGRDALDRLRQLLVGGGSVALAVDGPAGPAFRVKRGCVELAAAAGVPVIPVAYRSARALVRNERWDRQVLVFPFDRVEVTVG